MNLINYSEASRLLTGNRTQVVRKTKLKKYKPIMKLLRAKEKDIEKTIDKFLKQINQ